MQTFLPGHGLVLRPITADDKDALTDALHRLSADTVHKRFLSSKPDFTASELRYLTEVDGADHVALVATPPDAPERIVAVGRYVRLRNEPDTAEIAIVVGDHLQGRGLGKRIGLELADIAREHGIAQFTATMLADNVAAHRLMESIAERIRQGPRESGVDSLLLDIAA